MPRPRRWKPFTVTKNEQHPTELAGLRGARLVSATEIEEGRRWDETKIKMLTGGDRNFRPASCGKISSSMCRSSNC